MSANKLKINYQLIDTSEKLSALFRLLEEYSEKDENLNKDLRAILEIDKPVGTLNIEFDGKVNNTKV